MSTMSMAELNLSMGLPGIPRLVVALAEWLGIAASLALFPRRFSKGVTALLLGAMLAGQVYLRCFLSDYDPMSEFYLVMVLNILYMLPCIALLIRGKTAAVVSCWGLSFIMAETNASLSWPLAGLLFETPDLAQAAQSVFVCTVLIATQGIMVHCFKRAGLAEVQDKAMPTRILLLSLMAFVASNYFILFSDYDSSMRFAALSLSFCRFTVDLCGVVLTYNLLMSSRRSRMEREMLAIRGIVKAQYQQYRDYQETTSYISRQCHDLKHQLAVLRDTKHQAELRQEIDKMKAMVDHYEAYTNTGNAVLDAILTQKMIYCREHGIQMSYTADAASLSAIRTVDICNLFGNLLDNAIEHTQTLNALEDRQVILTAQPHGQLLVIDVENRCDREPDWQDGTLRTTKADETMHGFGCKSVAYTAAEYGGTAQFHMEDGWFIASVLLPVHMADQGCFAPKEQAVQ